jgi:U4/U6 small nuclear ribonucleoprotein PRP4
VGGISWFPGATLETSNVSKDSINLATAAQDTEVHLWSLSQDTPVATLSGHSARVCRTEFHPSGRYLASAGYDTTWRLWDVNTTQELLLQEGHSKEVYTVSFNEDGSLISSAGLDSIGRVWDIRSGRTVMLLESHVAPIHAMDWSSDGVRVMTGSADGFAKCWDLRNVKESASIGAHVGGVSDLRWFKGTDGPLSGNMPQSDTVMTNGDGAEHEELQPKKSGTFIVSSGFDKAVNIFSADDWALCKSLTGHDGTVLAVDTTSDAKWIASCGRDRTVKLWARDDMEGI